MHAARPLQVMIFTHSAAAAKQLSQALDPTATTVVDAAGPEPAILLTDLTADQLADQLAEQLADRLPHDPGRHAVVTIAPAAWGDATLAADFTDRELALACQLVAEIARLRRERDELVRVRQEVTRLAETDPLTGLANRRAWERALASIRASRSAQERPSWLALVDLDDFKAVNDARGMAHGDRMLAAAGQSLARQVRGEDLVARIGGDEFGVLLDAVPRAHIEQLIDRLRRAIADETGQTASIGYVAVDSSIPVEALLAAAERAMRLAKSSGGNRVALASSPSASDD